MQSTEQSKPLFVLAGCVAQAESSMVFEKSDFVDMEGYAIAKVAGMFNKPCMMLKIKARTVW